MISKNTFLGAVGTFKTGILSGSGPARARTAKRRFAAASMFGLSALLCGAANADQIGEIDSFSLSKYVLHVGEKYTLRVDGHVSSGHQCSIYYSDRINTSSDAAQIGIYLIDKFPFFIEVKGYTQIGQFQPVLGFQGQGTGVDYYCGPSVHGVLHTTQVTVIPNLPTPPATTVVPQTVTTASGLTKATPAGGTPPEKKKKCPVGKPSAVDCDAN